MRRRWLRGTRMLYTYYRLFNKLFGDKHKQIIMLTRGEARGLLNALLVLSLLGLVFAAAALAMTIIKQYVAFGLYSNPISCTSSNAYFTIKYNHNNYVAAIDVAEAVSVFLQIAVVVLVILLKVKLSKSVDEPEKTFQSWSQQLYRAKFMLVSVSLVCLVVPTGYFVSFFIEVGGSCSSSVLIEWIITAALAGLALALNLALLIVLFLQRAKFEGVEQEQQEKEIQQQQEQQLVVLNPTEKLEPAAPTVHNQASKHDISCVNPPPQEFQESSDVKPLLQEKQSLKNSESLQKSSLREPLITVLQPPSPPSPPQKASAESQAARQQRLRLYELRRQRQIQEERIEQLRRKTKGEERDKEKAAGNQTIINIHLDGARGGSISRKDLQTKQEHMKTRRENDQERYGATIHQENSQEYAQYTERQMGRPNDSQRFYDQRQFKPKVTNPYSHRNENYHAGQRLRKQPSQNVAGFSLQPAKNLSLGHLPSVQITPTSPQHLNNIRPTYSNAFVPENKNNDSSILKVHGKNKNEESFYKQLMEESVVKEKYLQAPRAPKKGKKPKNNGLEAYIEALNMQMAVSRPGYDNNYLSNGSEGSYTSVLSNRDGVIPAERDFYMRQNPQLANSRGRNLLSVTQRIEEKYKRK